MERDWPKKASGKGIKKKITIQNITLEHTKMVMMMVRVCVREREREREGRG